MYTELLSFPLFWVVKTEKLLYYSKVIYLYCKKNLGRIPKMLQVELQRKSPAHYPMSRPLSLSCNQLSCNCFDQWWRHRLWSRPHLLSVPSLLMSRPQLHVATSLSFYSFSFRVATSVLGCDHFSVCMMTSCCDFYFLVAILLVVFLPSYV